MVTVERWDGRHLPYVDNLVNLVIAEDPGQASEDELLRVAAPGGVVLLREGQGWKKLIKPRPAALDEWTHWRHGADGNMVSQDKAVELPQGVKWIASPPPWVIDNTGNSDLGLVTANGRNFYNFKESLVARDAFNGALLWTRELGTPYYQEKAKIKGPNNALAKRTSRAQPVAVGAALYVISGKEVLELDAATGATRRTLGEVADPLDMLVEGGRLVISAAGGMQGYDLAAGKLAWSSPVKMQRIAAGGGGVYGCAGAEAVCLELATGQARWRSSDAEAAKAATYTYHDGVVIYEQWTQSWSFQAKGCGLVALSARDGATLWRRPYAPKQTHNQEARALVAQGLIWINDGTGLQKRLIGLDPKTGQERKAWTQSGGNHCSPPLATERFFIAPECDFTDFATGEMGIARMARHACRIPFIPANGQLYTLPLNCECYPLLRGVMSLTSGGSAGIDDPERLVRGEAYEKKAESTIRNSQSAIEEEWPTYRHDAARSGATPGKVPAGRVYRAAWLRWVAAPIKEGLSEEMAKQPPVPVPVTPLATGGLAGEWEKNPFSPGLLTAPVAAGGLLVVAVPDAHRIVALDAKKGDVRWTFIAGGRVDTPPTLADGLCLFGAHDGWVYAVDAASGKLAWRYRVAPREARIAAYGQLESLWPVIGSVLVKDGVAYAAAGRHPMSDGGFWVYALKARTGEVVWSQKVNALDLSRFYGGRLSDSKDAAKIGRLFTPIDVPVLDGTRVAVSRWRFDAASGAPQAELLGPTYDAGGRRAPLGMWDYGPLQGKELPEMPAAVLDDAGLYKGKVGQAALLTAGGVRLAVTAAGAIEAGNVPVADLGAPVVHNGLIAAYGKLYAATQKGEVVCLEAPGEGKQ